MKKFGRQLFLCVIMVTFFASYLKSQSVNGTPISEIEVDYIRIVGTSKLFSKKVNVEIDFGQNTKFFGTGKETQIMDENGKKVKFNSMIDALNYMSEHGYQFMQAYAINVQNQNVYHYLMEKRSIEIDE